MDGVISTGDGEFFDWLFSIEKEAIEKYGSDKAKALHNAEYAQFKGEKLSEEQIKILKENDCYISN